MPARKHPSQPSARGLPLPPVPPPRPPMRAAPVLSPMLQALLRVGKETVCFSARPDECATFLALLIEAES